MNKITVKTIVYLIVSIIGNPFYTFIAYIYTENNLDTTTEISTNVNQINIGYFILILLLIFVIRLYIYQFIIIGRIDPLFTNFKFFNVFVERHVFQFFGVLLFILYTLHIEGNVFGFFYLPLTIISIIIVNPITIFRLFRINKKYNDVLDNNRVGV